MPLPTPAPDESESQFVSRCMTEASADYPNEDQRQAVCEQRWENWIDDAAAAAHYPRIASYVRESPWAILPATLDTIVELIKLRSTGARLSDEEIRLRIGAAAAAPAARALGKIAVLPIFGVISHRMNMMTEISGGTSTEQLAAAFQRAVKDPDVGAIVLDVDSPGGNVAGIQELGDLIFNARGAKPTIAVANATCASAAYWLASQADEIVCTPSGQVGSIGVLAVHEDLTKQAEKLGVKVTYVSAGAYKTEGQPFVPLSDEARADLQAKVDEYYGTFLKAVARGRGVSVERVRTGFGEGRLVSAAIGQTLNMIDRVETLEATITRLGGQPASTSGPRAQVRETMNTPSPTPTEPRIETNPDQIVVGLGELQALREKASRAERLEDLQKTLEQEAAEHAILRAQHQQERIAFKLRGVKLPAFRPFVRALLEIAADAPEAKTFVLLDEKTPVGALAVVDALIAEVNRHADGIFKTFSSHVPAQRPDPDEPEATEAKIDYRVKQYCRINKLDPAKDYATALKAVLNADPELKAAYTAA